MERAMQMRSPCVLLLFSITAGLSASAAASHSYADPYDSNAQLSALGGIGDTDELSQAVCTYGRCSPLGEGCLALTLLASTFSFLLGRYSVKGRLASDVEGAIGALSNIAAQLLLKLSIAALSLATVLKECKTAAPTAPSTSAKTEQGLNAGSKAAGQVGSDGTDDFTSAADDVIGTRADPHISNSNSVVSSSGCATAPDNTTAGSNSATGQRIVSAYSAMTTGWSCIFSKTAVSSEASSSSPPAGDQGNHISLGLLLGAGSFGKVYQGSWRGAKVAVKVITQLGTAAAQQVRREVELMLKVKHPNVVQSHHVIIWQRTSPSSIMGSSSSNISSGSYTRLANCFSAGSATSSKSPGSFTERSDSSPAAAKPTDGRLSLRSSGSASDAAGHTSASSAAVAAAQCWPVGSSGDECDLDNEQDDDQDGIVETQTWIVQELCTGGTLDDAARNGDLEEPMAQISCLLDVSRGMQYLHKNNIMHGDLKCSNVCLMKVPNHPALPSSSSGNNTGSGDGVKYSCKVADFSLTRTIDAGKDHHSTKSLGTVTHLAPELLSDGRQTPACDVYSFGMLIWELLHKKSPFSKCTHEVEILEKIIVKQERPAWDHQGRAAAGLTALNSDLIRLAEQCWDQEPSRRPTFAQVCARLEEMQQGLTAAAAAAAAEEEEEEVPAPTVRDIAPPLESPMRFSTAWTEEDLDLQVNVDSANNMSSGGTSSTAAATSAGSSSSSSGAHAAAAAPQSSSTHGELHRSFSFGKSSRLSLDLEPIPEQTALPATTRSPSFTKKGLEILRRSADSAMLFKLKQAGKNNNNSCTAEDFVPDREAAEGVGRPPRGSSETPSGFKRALKREGKSGVKGYEAFAQWLMGSEDVPLLKQPTQQQQERHGPVVSYCTAPEENKKGQQGAARDAGVTWIARRSLDVAGKKGLPHSGYWA